jgi:glycosyltransferase involved in cell wall biosynthesis
VAHRSECLRVALIAGTLGRSGAEKQLYYMARALRSRSVTVEVFCLTRNDFYERELARAGIPVHWAGQFSNPASRLATLMRRLTLFRPHILQSAHFFTNLYAVATAPVLGSVVIGAIRNDALLDVDENGGWGRWLLRLPPALIVNSFAARTNAEAMGVRSSRIHVIQNVIDLEDFDRHALRYDESVRAIGPVAIAVGRLAPEKRFDRFLTAIAGARRDVPTLTGVIIGEGPERPALERLAQDLGLMPDGAVFLRHRHDVPALMRQADMLVLCSDHEGFPNVLLEGMAAGLPAITTPAGDADIVVQHDDTGAVVAFDDVDALIASLVRLSRSPELRTAMGKAGRRRVEDEYSYDRLLHGMLSTYEVIAEQQGKEDVIRLLSSLRENL